jgi:predicted RNase H-like HicB family nuclease
MIIASRIKEAAPVGDGEEAPLVHPMEFIAMVKQRYIYWQDDDAWLGYLEEYPDHWTQGESEAELKEHLIDLYKELTSGAIPNVRRVAELDIA